jgi:hypothetical protein
VSAPPETSAPRPSDAGPSQWLWGVGALVVLGFIVLVVSSARQAAVPVGVSGGMSGMSMPDARGGAGMRMSMRDIDGRAVRIPDGRPGVVVFVESRSCAACVGAVRATARALRPERSAVALTVVNVDSATTRGEVTAFARRAGEPRARYVVDDRNGSLASMFGASGLGAAVVYDAGGKVVSRPASAAGVARALVRAAK